MAAEYPDFQPQAKEIQNKLLLLKAAEQDAYKAQQELKYLENPELRPKEPVKADTPTPPKPAIITLFCFCILHLFLKNWLYDSIFIFDNQQANFLPLKTKTPHSD